MNWFFQLHLLAPIAYATLVLAMVVSLGLGLGSLSAGGVRLGVAGVLFIGLAIGHFGVRIEPNVQTFARDFGLILFVYSIGMTVGPGFLSSLRKQGIPLNLLAAAVVLLGTGVTIVIGVIGNLNWAAAVGLFAGATTNTPALAAAQEALGTLPGVSATTLELPALGYAAAYPFGIIGIILSMVAVRAVFRIDSVREAEDFRHAQSADHEPIERMTLRVENSNLEGLKLEELPGRRELAIVISRIKPAGAGEVTAAHAETPVHRGDLLLAVGPASKLEKFRLIVGSECPEDLTRAPGQVTSTRVVVTRKSVIGKTLRELALRQLHAVTVSRVTRADLEVTAVPELKLQFGDMLQLVGEARAVERVSQALGNSFADMSYTNLVPIFVGIGLGVLAGSYPFSLSFMPAPVKLGLAGGPLLVAIILSRIGKIGPLVWYMPVSANVLLRELGIVLFLAAVGLKAG